MKTLAALLPLVLTASGCIGTFDGLYEISASAQVTEPLPRQCVLDSLNDAEVIFNVTSYDAWETDYLSAHARARLPEDIPTRHATPGLFISQSTTDGRVTVIEIKTSWAGRRETSEFVSYVQGLFDDLVAEILEQCALNA